MAVVSDYNYGFGGVEGVVARVQLWFHFLEKQPKFPDLSPAPTHYLFPLRGCAQEAIVNDDSKQHSQTAS